MNIRFIGFTEERFPENISCGSSGGPEYSTDIIRTANGYEQRNINWSKGLGKYNVAHGIKTEAELHELLAFFRSCKGRAIGFRFKDWADYKAISQPIGIGDGKSKIFQLHKHYTTLRNSIGEFRKIQKPVKDTIKIYFNGNICSDIYSISYETGVITFKVAPDKDIKITADFEFDIPARFDTDHLTSSIDGSGIHSWNNIPIVEIRL